MESEKVKEIKKGLKVCNGLCRKDCPYHSVGCMNDLSKDSLTLINELESENKRLKNRIICKIVVPDDKLEKIKNECLEKIEVAKDKLLKQFAERLKEKLTPYSYVIVKVDVIYDKIDETLKELQGE